ncbi:MAG: electron transfer flavoprotein subunit alpha/FixB family protein [Fimbriimonadales bacterium]|nr:electron transfer flavoprotein subunit alpha/FixB family protein [Fimbriimonadales bacterium]MDW8052135.1 electron transfer flavoprotein subunit alpha/FixB family protein [Armatimonadota bacterium]
MKVLVVAETNGERVLEKTLPAIAFAQQKASDGFTILAIGNDLQGAEALAGYGAQVVLAVNHPALAKPLAERYAPVIAHYAQQLGVDAVVATTSTFSRDVLARVAGMLDAPMLSDIITLERTNGKLVAKRPIYSANLIGTFEVEGTPVVITVRGPAWGKPEPKDNTSPVQAAEAPADIPTRSEWLSLRSSGGGRPDLTQARVVVSGGRPLKDPETFERYIGGLADVLGGAAGATRAAVDAGIAPNELQVGQTGKTVAPELYIAVGISGSVQHLAGMKDSKVIVAINIDPEAPIFQVADYGLVADLYQAVPELIELLKNNKGA